jgi:hypothetical protein
MTTRRYIKTENVDCWGDDMGGLIDIPFNECEARCNATAGCVGFIPMKESPNGKGCWLKSKVTPSACSPNPNRDLNYLDTVNNLPIVITSDQCAAQVSALNKRISDTDAEYVARFDAWQKEKTGLTSQLAKKVTDLAELESTAGQTQRDLSNAEVNISTIFNKIGTANNQIASHFINSRETFSSLFMKEPFDTVSQYQSNIENVNTIVLNEQERLNKKKKSVDDALFTQNRMIEFNENLRKRYAAFNYIIVTWVIAFLLLFIILLLSRFFPFPTSFLITVIIAIAIIVSGWKLYDIYSRWNMDYEVYKLQPPVLQTVKYDADGHLITPAPVSASASSDKAECVGAKCCSQETVWSASLNTCTVPTTIQPFGNMDASEFEKYATYV